MDRFELYNISETYMELLNPTSPEKIITLGKYLRLREGSRVIDFGCGFAEPLVLWAERYGISGVGVDVRPHACVRARDKLKRKGLEGRIEIVCAHGAEYDFQAGAFDAATCIGATFVFGGYRQTIQAMHQAIRPNGRLGIGEIHWLTDHVSPAFSRQYPDCVAEHDLIGITREEGFDLEYLVRASLDDWDRYRGENWYGLIRWLEQNPGHPDRPQVLERLRSSQDAYSEFEREYLGWAMYALVPAQPESPVRGGIA